MPERFNTMAQFHEAWRRNPTTSYRDYEGFADPVKVVELCSPVYHLLKEEIPPTQHRFFWAVLTNLVFETADASEDPFPGSEEAEEIVFAIGHTVIELLTVHEWVDPEMDPLPEAEDA